MARGVVYVHSAPAALCPHVEWAIAGVLGVPTGERGERLPVDWSPQPAQKGTFRAEFSWTSEPGTSARLASALRGWEHLRFEVTEEASPTAEGARYCGTPDLGIFHAVTGLHGDLMIPEDRLRATLADVADLASVQRAVDQLLGTAWDEELEPFRYAGDGAPVRWLHQVG